MLEQFPFWDRAALLAGLMVVGAAVEWWKRGRAATRYKEYGFIWLTGFIGCLVGGANDFITSSVSPGYFVVGKGLAPGDEFHLRAVIFGVQEGLSAGVVAGAICVYVARRKSRQPPLGFDKVLGQLWKPVICAVVGALLVPLLVGGTDPAKLAARLSEAGENAAMIPAFLRVWWIHTGLYAGLLAGLIWLIAAVLLARKKL